jgi:DHA2 family multidrug resistance protein
MDTARAAPRPLEAMTGSRLLLVAAAVGIANFMQTLDITIANVAVPTISGNLGVSADQGTWMLTSFAASLAITLPLTGWLSQRFGQVRLFVASVTLFVITSMLCGLAPNFPSLLLFRALQGAVSGPLAALSQALLVAVFPPAKRATALAVWQVTTFVAPVCGPILGGYITDNISWQWIFYINGPIGIFVVVTIRQILRGRDSPTRLLPVDFVGLGLLSVAVGSLQIMLDEGQDLDWFNAVPIRVLAILTVLGFASLIIWELTERHPILDLSLFARRNFAAGTLAITVGFSLYFGALVLVPLWLQTEMGYTATWAGVATAPLGIAGIVLIPLVGRFQSRLDPRWFASMSLVAWALASLWRMGFSTDIDVGLIAWNSLLMGAGTAFFLTPLVSISIAGLPADKIPAALGLQNALRRTGTSFATSLAPTFWERRAHVHTTHLVDHVALLDPSGSQSVAQLEAAGLPHQAALEWIARTIDSQAHMLALNDFSFACAILFSATLVTVWLSQPQQVKRA